MIAKSKKIRTLNFSEYACIGTLILFLVYLTVAVLYF